MTSKYHPLQIQLLWKILHTGPSGYNRPLTPKEAAAWFNRLFNADISVTHVRKVRAGTAWGNLTSKLDNQGNIIYDSKTNFDS